MSWNPFNKLIAPKKTNSKLFDDAEIDTQAQQVAQAEHFAKKLHKDTKKYVESNISLSKIEQRMWQDLLNSSKQIKDADEVTEHAEKLREIAYLSEESEIQKDAITRTTFLQPVKGMCEKFPSVHSAIKRREQSQQDYAKYLTKREKLSRDSNSTQSGKFDANEKYLERTKTDFDRRTKELNEDLPKFLIERLNYFDPCFKALLQSQLNHCEKTKSLYDQVGDDVGISVLPSEAEFEKETEKMLEDIRALSIVKVK